MTKKDIIFYSNFCTYCKEVINEISKTPINDNILYVCVDDDNIQLPNFVTAVPTIYLVEKKRIVVDEAIPKWVQEQLSKVENNSGDDIQAYFGSNDSSFGCSFSTLDNKEEKPFISSFTYLGEEQKINTPDDSNDSSPTNSRNNFQNSSTSNDFERLQNERQAEFQTIQRR
tara:strand:+ start:1545 stop:2057 length:513 start_codon:yes stop_codon:yes gene_type:complete